MSMRYDLFWVIMIFGLASLICRISGFWLMRYVTVTPRLKAALNATPLAVMVGIVTPAAASGKPAELLALAVIFMIMRLWPNDLAAAVAGMAVVALGRWLQLSS
jgi:uncharacterized membrane protein